MTIKDAFDAILFGVSACLKDSTIRKHAFQPWLIGVIVYLALVIGAYYGHGSIVAWFVTETSGFWNAVLYYVVWVFAALALFVSVSLATIVFVFALSGPFLTAIAKEILLGNEAPAFPEEAHGALGTTKEIGRSIYVETSKLLWILPLMVILFIGGFIQVLLPVCLCMSAWLLAAESLDVTQDIYHLPPRRRLGRALRYWLPLTAYGLPFTLVAMVPFLGFLVPPAAVAGLAYLAAGETSLIDTEA